MRYIIEGHYCMLGNLYKAGKLFMIGMLCLDSLKYNCFDKVQKLNYKQCKHLMKYKMYIKLGMHCMNCFERWYNYPTDMSWY